MLLLVFFHQLIFSLKQLTQSMVSFPFPPPPPVSPSHVIPIDGLYVAKKIIPVTGPPPDVMTPDQKKCYLYIDWNSSSPESWCLRFSSLKLSVSLCLPPLPCLTTEPSLLTQLRPYDEETESSILGNQPASTAIPLNTIRSVELAEYPSSTILVNVQGFDH
jgi:hypothetical protein